MIPAMDCTSTGTRMLEEERREKAEDDKLLARRRLQNLQQWRTDVEAAKAAGVKQYPYDAPLTFNERTAYDPPRVQVRRQPVGRGY